MTKPRNSTFRLKFVQAWVDRDGRAHFYFRRAGFPRVRLPGLIGSAEFMAAYQDALGAAAPPIGRDKRSKPGSGSAAIAAYFESRQHFGKLTGETPGKRRAILERFREGHGHLSLAQMPRKFIVALLDTMPPQRAKTWLKALRGFLRWAVDKNMIAGDPTLGIRITLPKSDGHHTWTEAEIAQFEGHHPLGSKPRLALALLLYTAQRRGDVVKLGRQHIRDGVLHFKQAKTGTPLALPVRPELQAVLDATPSEHLTFLVTDTGKPYSPNRFGEAFRKWCDEAQLPRRCTAHGLRKSACVRFAQVGCGAPEIASWSGHKTLSEVQRYLVGADQERLAHNALARTAAKQMGVA